MQLNSRVKKLESISRVLPPCQCQRPKTEVYFTREVDDGFTEPKCSSPIPDICDQCAQPIEKDSLTVHFVKARIPQPQI